MSTSFFPRKRLACPLAHHIFVEVIHIFLCGQPLICPLAIAQIVPLSVASTVLIGFSVVAIAVVAIAIIPLILSAVLFVPLLISPIPTVHSGAIFANTYVRCSLLAGPL